MAKVPSTAGQQAAAQTQAAALPAVSTALNLSAALPLATFPFIWRGQRILFEACVRKYCEQPLKAALQSAGADIKWES